MTDGPRKLIKGVANKAFEGGQFEELDRQGF
jgi:hypothetical protein